MGLKSTTFGALYYHWLIEVILWTIFYSFGTGLMLKFPAGFSMCFILWTCLVINEAPLHCKKI